MRGCLISSILPKKLDKRGEIIIRAVVTTATINDLRKTAKQIYLIKVQIQKQTHIDRKADTRKKIMLGGLFVKAELDHFYPHDPATLYGMLLYNRQMMESTPDILVKWKDMGKELIRT